MCINHTSKLERGRAGRKERRKVSLSCSRKVVSRARWEVIPSRLGLYPRLQCLSLKAPSSFGVLFDSRSKERDSRGESGVIKADYLIQHDSDVLKG